MSDLLITHPVTCPHCWETIEVQIDLSSGNQDYIEDCSVCCRPIALSVRVAGDELEEVTAEASE